MKKTLILNTEVAPQSTLPGGLVFITRHGNPVRITRSTAGYTDNECPDTNTSCLYSHLVDLVENNKSKVLSSLQISLSWLQIYFWNVFYFWNGNGPIFERTFFIRPKWRDSCHARVLPAPSTARLFPRGNFEFGTQKTHEIDIERHIKWNKW